MHNYLDSALVTIRLTALNCLPTLTVAASLTRSKVMGKGRMATVTAKGSHQEPLLASARDRLMDGNTMKNMVKPAHTFKVEMIQVGEEVVRFPNPLCQQVGLGT